MTRKRVQRPFTVEVKGRSRLQPAGQEISKPSTSSPPPSVLWAGTDLGRELARAGEKFSNLVSARPAEKQKVEARRVLPSLLVAEPITVEPDPEPTLEPRLPRVRRVTSAKKVTKTTRSKRNAASPANSQPPIRVEPAPQPTPATPARSAAPPIPLRVTRSRRSRAEAVQPLKPGQRWKRRLSRFCR
ncbi:conserved hypothetical protein (plasmid) [Methylobacterium nodulans ORS 2060]|uniref:Uncharacterized protein n=1 Tax=Methylobacterium nodulans (strain LMG 21967 / CNCM I-2342 / ORS 2060) TaxID=460265 RepID=B8IWS2_METNO|nr:conserved hypothetical protein [Methylobacterium nodulans ORS 2060]